MSSWNQNRIVKRYFKNPIESLPINKQLFVPTFHVLIATAGKPCLLTMLNSLKNELTENDAITIVFDGEDSIKKSNFSESWLLGHTSKINIIEQIPNLGFWGHAIRNKYQGILEPKTTFVMNADDDDTYVSGSFNSLRKLCSNKDILYIAKFFVKSKNIVVPSQNLSIIQDDIGTPCGIIPFDVANRSIWELRYGGDFNYYDNIKKYCQKIVFLNLTIYIVN
jgi:hypothetical protein